jgi:TetR/AcrR family transcriptional repressor of mexCD-oprJ operon
MTRNGQVEMPEPATDHRRAIAERNVEAILDGAERQLQAGKQASISAVAGEAGVSRVTVYAHFPDRERLVEALVERAVRRASEAIEAAEPDRGPAVDALDRVIEASWQELGRHEEIARAAAVALSGDAMRRTHESGRRRVRRLVERGRRAGDFRTDVGSGWLVSSFFALVHAAREEVRAGELDADEALEALSATLKDLFVGRRPR